MSRFSAVILFISYNCMASKTHVWPCNIMQCYHKQALAQAYDGLPRSSNLHLCTPLYPLCHLRCTLRDAHRLALRPACSLKQMLQNMFKDVQKAN